MRFRRIPMKPCGGGGKHFPLAEKLIRLTRHGCANRPFYHIVVIMSKRDPHDQPIEQLGSYDPMPNKFNEKLVALNLERLQYWLREKTDIQPQAAEILGLAGFLPIHPQTFCNAWKKRNARMTVQNVNKEKTETEETVGSS